MSSLKAPQTGEKSPTEIRFMSASFAGLLDDTEKLTGSIGLVSSPLGLTFTASSFNSAVVIINDKSVAVNEAVTFLAAAGTAGVHYDVIVTVDTTFGQKLVRGLALKVVDEPS